MQHFVSATLHQCITSLAQQITSAILHQSNTTLTQHFSNAAVHRWKAQNNSRTICFGIVDLLAVVTQHAHNDHCGKRRFQCIKSQWWRISVLASSPAPAELWCCLPDCSCMQTKKWMGQELCLLPLEWRFHTCGATWQQWILQCILWWPHSPQQCCTLPLHPCDEEAQHMLGLHHPHVWHTAYYYLHTASIIWHKWPAPLMSRFVVDEVAKQHPDITMSANTLCTLIAVMQPYWKLKQYLNPHTLTLHMSQQLCAWCCKSLRNHGCM